MLYKICALGSLGRHRGLIPSWSDLGSFCVEFRSICVFSLGKNKSNNTLKLYSLFHHAQGRCAIRELDKTKI